MSSTKAKDDGFLSIQQPVRAGKIGPISSHESVAFLHGEERLAREAFDRAGFQQLPLHEDDGIACGMLLSHVYGQMLCPEAYSVECDYGTNEFSMIGATPS